MADSHTATPSTGQPVLTFTTLIDRARVTIDGRSYEMRNGDEISMFKLARFERIVKRMEEIGKLDHPTELEPEYNAILDDIAREILIAPTEVHEQLRVEHREALFWTFIGRSRPRRSPPSAPNTPTATPSKTQARSRRGSRASSAGRRKAG